MTLFLILAVLITIGDGILMFCYLEGNLQNRLIFVVAIILNIVFLAGGLYWMNIVYI